MDQLSTKVRPKKKYETNRAELDRKGITPMEVVKTSIRDSCENNGNTYTKFKTSF